MSTPPGMPVNPLADTGNPLLQPVPSVWKVGMHRGTGIVTICTASTSLSLLTRHKKDVLAWAAMLAELASQMSDSGLEVAGGQGIFRPDGQGPGPGR